MKCCEASAKCLASEAKSEAIELFDSLQLGVAVSGGAEAIIHSSKIKSDDVVSALSYEDVTQIYFQSALNSVKRSHLYKATYEFIHGIAAFTSFCYSQHKHNSFLTVILFKKSKISFPKLRSFHRRKQNIT